MLGIIFKPYELILEKKIIPPLLGVGFNRNISLFLSLENYSDCILAGSKKDFLQRQRKTV